ncbi:helix-turn-helix domain-containing protein [Tumebacillus sp. ITR2]|uniref:Helix-turn-helix domain-containing protein n=1 Tax=Tumebacillus amylolyticus TaxID=2801339 RepID=A0ABS1J6L1_9BACL|nr:helix-turn-helix domain-containing protein [Tumebacillus amylolyticus]MBL0385908.1 helix-turn-helix domain-containing protein [Tumebacillus amylolyticus]
MNRLANSSSLKDLVVLGTLIKELREIRGLTQGDLARGLCTASMISQVETGKARPSLDLLTEVAKRLKVDVNFFFENKKHSAGTLSYFLAKAYMGARKYTHAMHYLQDLLNARGTYGDSIPLLVDLVHCYLHLGKLAEAEQLLRAAGVPEDPDLQARLLEAQGLLLTQAKRYDKAIPVFEKAVAILTTQEHPDLDFTNSLLLTLAEAHDKLGQTDRALELVNLAAPSAGSRPSLLDQAKTCLHLAKEFHQKGIYTKAIHYADRARHLQDLHHHRVEARRNRMEATQLHTKTNLPADDISTLARLRADQGDYREACVMLLHARAETLEKMKTKGIHLTTHNPPFARTPKHLLKLYPQPVLGLHSENTGISIYLLNSNF